LHDTFFQQKLETTTRAEALLMKRSPVLVLIAVTLLPNLLLGEAVIDQAMRAKKQWVQKWLAGSESNAVPFTFKFNGIPSAELLKAWFRLSKLRQLDAGRIEHALTWTDPKTGLEVRCVAVEYLDFPVVEWTVYFRNTGGKDTPILEDVQGLDITIQSQKEKEFRLHGIDGDRVGTGYTPRLQRLQPGTRLQFSPVGGRPTNGSFPYYDLEWTGQQGLIIAVGWPGQWASSFTRDQAGNLRIRAGQELTRLTLHPGEELRSPLIVHMFWRGGDWIQAQNLWRRWMRTHNTPTLGGKDISPILAGSTVYLGLPNYSIELNNEKDQQFFIQKYADEKLNLNYWWMDIYMSSTNFWWKQDIYGPTGLYLARNWKADPKLFPNGLRAVSEFARSKGMRTIAWYEPEHVWPGNKLFDEHPDWLLSAPPDPATRRAVNQGLPLGNRRLLNLGKPEVVNWMVEHFSRTLKKEEIDIYRQDFNIEPLVFWRYSDPPDRQGITENFYVQGYLRYLDELLKRNPKLLVDTCASGGRRNDIETLRRAVPLWRSDDFENPVTQQNQTYGLAFWIPYFGTGIVRTDSYAFRSTLASSLLISWNVRDKKLDYDTLRQRTGEFWRVASYFVEDYYPLTEFPSGSHVAIAWQFDRPDHADGMVQAFARDENTRNQSGHTSLRLHALDPAAQYDIRDFDLPTRQVVSGRDLMQRGLQVEFRTTPAAAVFLYKRADVRASEQ
jgi:alpha-galactosidase